MGPRFRAVQPPKPKQRKRRHQRYRRGRRQSYKESDGVRTTSESPKRSVLGHAAQTVSNVSTTMTRDYSFAEQVIIRFPDII